VTDRQADVLWQHSPRYVQHRAVKSPTISLLYGFRYDVRVAGRELSERSEHSVSEVQEAQRDDDDIDRSAN